MVLEVLVVRRMAGRFCSKSWWANHNTDSKGLEARTFTCSEELNTLWKTATCRLLVLSRQEVLVRQTEPDSSSHLRSLACQCSPSRWGWLDMLFFTTAAAAAAAKLLQSCPTLCEPIDGSPPGSPVPGILQARTTGWVAISFSNAWKWKVQVKSLSHVRLLATPWTAAHQAPPSMGFSRQEYWSGVPLQAWLLEESVVLEMRKPQNSIRTCVLSTFDTNIRNWFQKLLLSSRNNTHSIYIHTKKEPQAIQKPIA